MYLWNSSTWVNRWIHWYFVGWFCGGSIPDCSNLLRLNVVTCTKLFWSITCHVQLYIAYGKQQTTFYVRKSKKLNEMKLKRHPLNVNETCIECQAKKRKRRFFVVVGGGGGDGGVVHSIYFIDACVICRLEC